MNLNVFFGCCLLLAALQQGHTSALKDGIAKILSITNDLAGVLVTQVDDLLLDRLQNETGIKEWSANIQDKVVSGAVQISFNLLDSYKNYILSKPHNPSEETLLNCLTSQESILLETAHNASIQNGWCNNRLAWNLTAAFQDVTKNSLKVNLELKENINSLSSCSLDDDYCLSIFLKSLVQVVSNELNPLEDNLLIGLQDVIRVYKIMFGEDVPSCFNEYMLPIFSDGLQEAFRSFTNCILG